jgi:two-component system response regulator FixJ
MDATINNEQVVHVIDDDDMGRTSLSWMLATTGARLEAHESPEAFLDDADANLPSCLILDMHLPGQTGLDVLVKLKRCSKRSIPVIMLAEAANVVTAVASMKLGVHDFLEKPVAPETLLATVREALAADAARRADEAWETELKARVRELTERERQVLSLVCDGKSNKQIAFLLDISAKTVSIHREHMMKKMQAANASDVVRMAMLAGAA